MKKGFEDSWVGCICNLRGTHNHSHIRASHSRCGGKLNNYSAEQATVLERRFYSGVSTAAYVAMPRGIVPTTSNSRQASNSDKSKSH